MTIESLPEFLRLPPRLMPIYEHLNDRKYFLMVGGRGSGKTQAAARVLLWISEHRRVKVLCGRELESSIEESVYSVLKGLIINYNLNFEVRANKIIHRVTGSEFVFKGFREQGRLSIQGFEGVDIVWLDEAQAITRETLKTLIPTIRVEDPKFFFTMNRFRRDDAVFVHCQGREDVWQVHINYNENPFCTRDLRVEAATMMEKFPRDYRHVWLGEPVGSDDNALFNYDDLWDSLKVSPFGGLSGRHRVIGFDFAAGGKDECVATILDRRSYEHWELVEQISWSESDTMESVGRIVGLMGKWKPECSALDVGGMGHVVYDRLKEVGVDLLRFDGASTRGVDLRNYGNLRSHGYFMLRDWFEQGHLKVGEKDRDCLVELEGINIKLRSNGQRLIESKIDIKKKMGHSPDRADSLMMACWAAHQPIGGLFGMNGFGVVRKAPRRVRGKRLS